MECWSEHPRGNIKHKNNMSLRNFHANADVTENQLKKKAIAIAKDFRATFRQMAANGNFQFGPFKLQDGDMNRIHAIVNEIDGRRLFYACDDDEIPKFAMQSLYETRQEIRKSSKGVWANLTCEKLVQQLLHDLADFATKGERLHAGDLTNHCSDRNQFLDLATEMRLKVWTTVAILKIKMGSIINPMHLPEEILQAVSGEEI